MFRQGFHSERQRTFVDNRASGSIDHTNIHQIVKTELDALNLPQIKEWRVRLKHARQVQLTALLSERIPDPEFKELRERISKVLSPLRCHIQTVRGHRHDLDNLHRLSRSESRYERDALQRDANRTLPAGIDLLRVHRYEIPLEKGVLDFAIFRLHVPEGREPSLSEWQKEFEKRNQIEIFIERTEGYEGFDKELKRLAGRNGVLGLNALPAIRKHLADLDPEPPEVSSIIQRARLPKNLPDLRSRRVITIDPKSTRDMEDALHASYLPNEDIRLQISFIDITWFLEPKSLLELHAQKLGATQYGGQRTIPTLGRKIAESLASFNLNEDRVGWMVDLIVRKDGTSVLERQPYRALVRSHERLSPEEVDALLNSNNGATHQLSIMHEAARRLQLNNRDGRHVYRIKGEGAAYQIVSEAAIAGKFALANFLNSHPSHQGIFKVHTIPTPRILRELLRGLKELGINGNGHSLSSPLEFAATLQQVQDITMASQPGTETFKKATALMQKIIDTFLTRSRFDLNNIGHYGLGIPSYMEIKPRDASGITNQFQLRAAIDGSPSPFTLDEVRERAENRNRLLKSYDWSTYELRFFEMLEDKLSLVGQVFEAEVTRRRYDSALIDVPGFSRWGVLTSPRANLNIGNSVKVKLLGFDYKSRRFKFEYQAA